jgi:pimeloyl-ACP methyl ester carboxylesterase
MGRRRLRRILLVIAVLALVLARPAAQHARAASLLMTFSNADAKTTSITERRITFGDGVPARFYIPNGIEKPPAVVLVHGVHWKGIDEPRLERFARAIAGVGVAVMTPLVADLADYRVDPRSIDTVGDAIEAARSVVHHERVGVMGMSFGGGVALLAASDARYAEHVSFVVAVGAHDDLGRVSRFFLEDAIARPDGSTQKLKAHGYGTMVLVHAHAERFFAEEDLAEARSALREWLHEDRPAARAHAERLSAAGRAKMEALFGDGSPALREEIAADLAAHEAEMKRVSPRGNMAGLRASVYLLHGAGDSVIPAAETLWLAQDVPAGLLRRELVSPAIEHVELKSPSTYEQWELVHFMGSVIAEAEASP